MSTVVHPIGPEPPRTYWVRRVAMVIIGIIVLIATVVFIKALISGSDDNAAQAEPSVSPTTAAPVGPCADGSFTVTTTMSKRTYPAGESPVITLSILGTGSDACSLDVGEAARQLLITSGSDRIWMSQDCPAEPASSVVTLEPGVAHSESITWPIIRSAPQCPSGLPTPRPGTYHLVATVGTVAGEDTVFTLG